MRITKRQLKRIIREEYSKIKREQRLLESEERYRRLGMRREKYKADSMGAVFYEADFADDFDLNDLPRGVKPLSVDGGIQFIGPIDALMEMDRGTYRDDVPGLAMAIGQYNGKQPYYMVKGDSNIYDSRSNNKNSFLSAY